MKTPLQALLHQALTQLQQSQYPQIHLPMLEQIRVDHTKDKQFGDFSSNIALVLAKPLGLAPREFAQLLLEQLNSAVLNKPQAITKISLAGPGFINFYIDATAHLAIIPTILQAGASFGQSSYGKQQKIHIEYVSANPTGPLHVGHGRGAAYGAALANLLATVGYDVHREYYVNDAGRQMHILAVSVWLRYLALFGAEFTFPSNGYRGDYVIAMAELLQQQQQDQLVVPVDVIYQSVPADEQVDGNTGGDKEAHIDGLIRQAKQLLGPTHYQTLFTLAKEYVLSDIQQDLAEFNVIYQQWFSEQSLIDSDALDQALAQLQQKELLYEQDGALWFKATEFGDDKDRVIRKENGERTYFANDIAYHINKYQRGFDQVIDVFGADHHGYIPRIEAMLKAFEHDTNDFHALLVQFAILYRGAERVQMSTRSGSFVTLRELRTEVGNDAARFFYVMRKHEQHMDFDLALAKSQSNDNPVYYVQYAHARICSVLRQLAEQAISSSDQMDLAQLAVLTQAPEIELMSHLSRYQEVLVKAAKHYAPHQLVTYIRELATLFHAYYNAHKFIITDSVLRDARIQLIKAVKIVLQNSLAVLGVSAPERM